MRPAVVRKKMFWREVLVLMDCSLLPEGSDSNCLWLGWEGSATIFPTCFRVLEVYRSWRDGRLQSITFSAERMQSALVLGSGSSASDGDGLGEDGLNESRVEHESSGNLSFFFYIVFTSHQRTHLATNTPSSDGIRIQILYLSKSIIYSCLNENGLYGRRPWKTPQKIQTGLCQNACWQAIILLEECVLDRWKKIRGFWQITPTL